MSDIAACQGERPSDRSAADKRKPSTVAWVFSAAGSQLIRRQGARSSLVQLRFAVWTGVTRDARPLMRRRRSPGRVAREVRAEDELTIEPTRLEATVCLDDLIKRDPLGDTRLGRGHDTRALYKGATGIPRTTKHLGTL